jgi:hypothetical protein
MSGYLSNLLTNTTSRYNTLRRTLLNNEDDGSTEDDSHISRVLRAYYTEKGQPFPPWLPPDPNDRRAITPQPYGQQSGYGTGAGGRNQYGTVQAQHAAGNRGSLSDLWDTPNNTAPAAPQSLRAGRRAPGGARPEPSSTLAPPSQARPLPSQRAGSYQSIQSQSSGRQGYEGSPPGSTTGAGSGGATAQERLKQRLWGAARANSASNSMLNAGPGQSQNAYGQPAAGENPYETRSEGRYGR